MNIIKQFITEAKIQALRYVISKQIFCQYSGKVLDQDNAIMIEADSDGRTDTEVIHGSFKDKLGVIQQRLTDIGCTNIRIFISTKNKKS